MRRCILRAGLTIGLLGLPLSELQAQGHSVSNGAQQNPTSRSKTTVPQKGTDESPLVIKVQPVPQTKSDSEQAAKERDAKAANDREILAINHELVVIGILQLFVFIGQLLVFGYQAVKLRQTVDASAVQSRDMKESIAQATRAAVAMEDLAKNASISARAATDNLETIRARTIQQMRAYISVLIGDGAHQDRPNNVRFGANPLMLNAGNTPAHKVSHRARAAILPVPLPEDFDFPLPDNTTEETVSEPLLAPHQNFTMNAIVVDYIDDMLVNDVKRANGSGLYVWGIVTYEDVFGVLRHTKFCHLMTWLPNGQIYGYYQTLYNDAD